MKKEDMFEVLNDIDDEYVEKANSKKKRGYTKWAALAASFCIVVIGVFAIFKPFETGAGIDVGGTDSGHYSIAVYPPYESVENVADAQIITLSETEAYSFETLGAALPTALPEGYSYQSGYLYDTTMKDGTKYYLLRVTFADGPRPEEIVTEDGGVMMPDPSDMPNEFYVLVTNYKPVENVELYASGDIGDIDINDIWFYHDGEVYCAIEAYDLSDDEIIVVLESMN